MPLTTVNGIELYYESHGSGTPLVLLGGLGSDVSELRSLIEPLAARYRVIGIDHRGSGRSAKPRAPYSIEQMADDVVGLLVELELPRAHVLGLSLGGRIAMALALDHPERVDHVLLVATSPRAVGTRWRIRLGMLIANLPPLRGQHPQPRRAMRAQFDASTRFDCTDRLAEIQAPTLIVQGRSDRTAPLRLAEQMHARIPNSHLVLVDGGHLFPLRQPPQLIAEVDAFLTESN